MSLLSDEDIYLFNEGTHHRLYNCLGVHVDGAGAHFAVWAPDAESVSVVGDWNNWDGSANPLTPRASSGVWEGVVPEAGHGRVYKYQVRAKSGEVLEKADPFGYRHEEPPRTASVVWELDYEWGDDEWMHTRHLYNRHDKPISVYELHIGSWRHEQHGRSYNYRELAPRLADYVADLGFTHVEFMPVMEHPFYGSWGYQVTGYFAPTSRFGSPQDFMYLVDYLHRRGIGVILDWVPAHFPTDAHGLGRFDGTHLYEHADPRKGFHPDWTTYIFNFDRHEVKSFLISSAVFWLDRYHIDGLRVDGVASMLYLDYSREPGEWIPNEDGSNENRGAVSFLQRLNETTYGAYPDTITIAEESTAWGGVSKPTSAGGLGFGFKWDLGWMHDTLEYMKRDPIHRQHHHGEITFRALYKDSENYILPLSHDEVVHGKGSLLDRMPGDAWRKLAQLRLLIGYMFGQPGKKHLFMGMEFGVWNEWNHEHPLDWPLLDHPAHAGVRNWVRDLATLYREDAVLSELDCDPGGFEWIDSDDAERSTLAFLRRGRDTPGTLVFVYNFTPVPLHNHRVALPHGGTWREVLNSDAQGYGGTGIGNLGQVEANLGPHHGRPDSAELNLPPFACVILRDRQ